MAARNPKPIMHSKRECNYLLATHGAAVAVACTHYGNNVGCKYCSYDCHYGGCNCSYGMNQAAATTTTATTATTATASTPTLQQHQQHHHGIRQQSVCSWHALRCYNLGQCTSLLHAMSTAAATAPHSPQSRCKCCYGTGIAIPTTRAART